MIPATMKDISVTSSDDRRGGLVSLQQIKSPSGRIHKVIYAIDDDETKNAPLPPQPSSVPYTDSVGHTNTTTARHRVPKTATSASKSKKLTFPSLTVSVTMQTYWAKRNRRRFGRFSITSCFHRNRRLPLILSFAGLLMTISSLSSMLFLKKQQLQYSQHQSVPLSQRSLEQQQQQQLHRRRQLRTSSKAAALGDVADMYTAHYLSFGSSFATEGSVSQSMQHKNDFIPYPYLLDIDVQLVAIPSIMSTWSPYSRYVDFVAACTQSLVDRTVSRGSVPSSEIPTNSMQPIPDVVTIEYTLEMDLTKNSYLVLMQRLRRRYPNALIVLVQLLQDPSKYLHLVEASSNDGVAEPNVIMNFQQWKTNLALSQQLSTSTSYIEELVQAMYEATMDGETIQRGRRYWAMVAPPATAKSELSSLLESDAQILHYSNPLWQANLLASQGNSVEFKEQMKLFWNHFSFAESDASTSDIGLSMHGHMLISDGLRVLVEEYMDRSKKIDRQTGNDNIGDWGSGDDCHIWYTNGDYGDIESVGGRTVDVPTVTNKGEEMDKETLMSNVAGLLRRIFSFSSSLPHKHALEFSRPKPSSYFDITSSSNNDIVVYNPFKTSRLLSISYLTDSDGMAYPKTLIVLNDIPSVQIQPIHELSVTSPTKIDTVNSNNLYSQQDQHIAKTSSVGYIPPGKSILRFIPLQNTILPFRLVGASILAEELQHSTEYAFEMDVATVPVTDVIRQ